MDKLIVAKTRFGMSNDTLSWWRLTPRQILDRTKMTEKWQRGEVSNFGYLMFLNMVAGRSYNDINCYPVFPWVVKDYTSNELDLEVCPSLSAQQWLICCVGKYFQSSSFHN